MPLATSPAMSGLIVLTNIMRILAIKFDAGAGACSYLVRVTRRKISKSNNGYA
jgi:hypothetical protein